MSGTSAALARRLNRVTSSTTRLTLRPWRAADAVTYRELWLQRDPRVPAERRVDGEGHPDLADLQQRIRTMERGSELRPWVVEDADTGEMIGYCGLTPGPAGQDDPAVVVELLRRCWGRGYGTEALGAVVDHARRAGHRRLGATARAWNLRSLALLHAAGFRRTGQVDVDPAHGDSVHWVLDL